MTIQYRVGGVLDLDNVIEVYRSSGLGERRPVDDRGCMAQMLQEANLIVTAWSQGELVGIARTLTDFCYVAYLADLAVAAGHQRRGIGSELIRQTQGALGPGATVVLLAAPAAEEYYPHIGFQHHPQAWLLRPGSEVVG